MRVEGQRVGETQRNLPHTSWQTHRQPLVHTFVPAATEMHLSAAHVQVGLLRLLAVSSAASFPEVYLSNWHFRIPHCG